MKKARLTEEQIIGILQEHEAGAKCADLCRKHGIPEIHDPMDEERVLPLRDDVSEAKRLKALEDGNAKPKRLLAEQMLDMAAMKELLSNNGNARREARGSRASEGPVLAVRTAGVPDCRGGPEDCAVSIAACA